MISKIPPADLRRQNLSYLVDVHGQAEVARRTGKPDRQIADILAKRASFGEKVARSMEQAWAKNTGNAIDLDIGTTIIEVKKYPASTDEESSTEYVGLAPAQRLVAVVGQAKLGENGWYDVVQEVGCDGFVEAISNDPDAYALRVLGDSMFPAIRNGWYVVVEPSHALNPSDFVAVALTDGRKMVKEFLYRTADEVGLQSVNGNKRLTLPLAEIATMHPIGSLVSPGKHRAA